MFQITVDNKIFYTYSAPNYVKKKSSSGAWIPSPKDDAEAISVFGEISAEEFQKALGGKNYA